MKIVIMSRRFGSFFYTNYFLHAVEGELFKNEKPYTTPSPEPEDVCKFFFCRRLSALFKDVNRYLPIRKATS